MKLNMYQLSLSGFMWRFYLLMAIVIIGFFTQQLWLVALAPIIFLSSMLGVQITKK